VDVRWKQLLLSGFLGVHVLAVAWYYYALPSYTRVGYMPEQPVPFSHALHVGQLGMNCQYCHQSVYDSPHATVPSTQTCMACHKLIKKDSPLLSQVRQSWDSANLDPGNPGNPVPWKRIHKLPEYAYFNHAVHVNRGVSCVSCHGQINEMPVVWHDKALSMGWCLNCHRAPTENLRPVDQVTNLTWKPSDEAPVSGSGVNTAADIGSKMKEKFAINPPQTCQGCHR
jgi:hypothetical protein